MFVIPEKRVESSCSCTTCKNMCKQSPCFPTPEEVEKLIDAGYKDQLMASYWGNLRLKHVLAGGTNSN